MAHVPYTFYAIDAEASPTPSDDEVRLMFQSLLADRFHLAAHRETRQIPGYALVRAKGPIKIKASQPEDPPAPLPAWFAAKGDAMSKAIEGRMLATAERKGITALTARRISIPQFVETLQD